MELKTSSISKRVLTAIKEGNCITLQNLIKLGVKVDTPGKRSWLPLHEATYFKQTTCLEILLKHDASKVNHQALDGETALIVACEQGCFESVKILLKYGADPNLQSRGGQNPLIAAVDSEHGPSLIPILLKHGANVNMNDEGHWNAVHSAVELEDAESFQMLLKAGLDPTKFITDSDEDSYEINKHWTKMIKIANDDFVIDLFILLRMYLSFNDWLCLASHASLTLPDEHLFHVFNWRTFTSLVPLSLLHLCRLKIRKCLMTSIYSPPSIYKVKIEQFQLPEHIIDILLFDESPPVI